MKFLLNMNVPRGLSKRLTAEGHECRHVGDIGMAQASDGANIFRLRNTHPDKLFARIMERWPEVEKPLLRGAIVVLEDAALRIRQLPIIQEE